LAVQGEIVLVRVSEFIGSVSSIAEREILVDVHGEGGVVEPGVESGLIVNSGFGRLAVSAAVDGLTSDKVESTLHNSSLETVVSPFKIDATNRVWIGTRPEMARRLVASNRCKNER